MNASPALISGEPLEGTGPDGRRARGGVRSCPGHVPAGLALAIDLGHSGSSGLEPAKSNTKVSDTVKAKAATYDPITANNTASTTVKVT